MRTTRGNTTLRLLAIVVVAALIGLKLVYRGYAAKLEAREAASQNTPLEWPPKPAPASDSVCDSVKLTMAQVDKANEEGLAVDQARRCITRETRAAHNLYLAERAAQRAQREASEQKQALELKIQQARKEQTAAAVAQCRELIAQYDLTEADLFGGRGRVRVAATGSKVAPKYRDPETGATWTGRGKPPKWIQDKNRDDYLIA